MKKQNLYVSIAVVILSIAAGVYLIRRPVAPAVPPVTASDVAGNRSFDLACDAGKALNLTFHLPEDKTVDVALSDGRTLSLLNTSSGDGSSYTSSEGNVVLALEGASLNLTEQGKPTYKNCALAGSLK
jgi:membrane-bound inhibitor of C-type lysozyme